MKSGNYSSVIAEIENKGSKNILTVKAEENEPVKSVKISGTNLIQFDRLYSKTEHLIDLPYNSVEIETKV
jgi:outer membrane protein assembly factor BamA